MNTNKSKKFEKKYYVQGMHCPSCEILVKQDVEALSGVSKVKASLSKSLVTVWADSEKSFPDIESLNKMFSDSGYSFSDKPVKEERLNVSKVVKILFLAVLFIGTFYLIEQSGILMRFTLDRTASLPAYFVFGLAAGISSCAALVGGLLLSLSKNWNEMYGGNTKQSIKPFVYFNVARIVSFALLGGFLGYLGSLVSVSMEFSSVLSILVAILMLILGLQMLEVPWFKGFSLSFLGNNKFTNKNLQNKTGKVTPFLIGAVTFFIPCGFTLIAQSNAMLSGSFVTGSLQLFAFSLGTLPMLALVSFSSVKLFSSPKFKRGFSLFSGALIVFFAFYTLNSQLNVLGFKSINDLGNKKASSVDQEFYVPVDNSGYQLIQMEAAGFDYYPKEIFIIENTKTKWEIYNNGAVGCANAVYGRELFPEVIYLEPGMNSVEFVSPKKGTYKISCSMGMVDPVTVHVL